MNRLACAFLFLAASANALAPNTSERPVARRQFFGILGSGAAGAALMAAQPPPAAAAVAKTGASSPFTGFYDDPNHPGCLRQVKVVGAKIRGDGTRSPYPVVEVKGYDGKGGDKVCADRPGTYKDLWALEGKLKSDKEALIDFSPKGGPANLLAKFEDNGIVFPDGNKWTKVALGTPDRLPVDMSTMKSN